MELTINAQARTTTGRKTDGLRAEGQIPAIVYGFEIEPTSIMLDRNAMERMYASAGESTALKLDIAGAQHDVLIQDIQRDPLTGFIIHADFRKVNMKQRVEAVISLVFVGEAPAVKELGATLIENLDEIEVLALPNALVREISVDISALKTLEDAIHVSDLMIPEGIEVLTEGAETVATVQPPRSEEELAALNAAVEENVESVEVTTEKKKDENAEAAK